jgi:Na+-transporting methylmalonyl-CoA/oxaloacetate decarboxylase gamma subunit
MNVMFGLSVTFVGLLVVFAGLILLILFLKLFEFIFRDRPKALPTKSEDDQTPFLEVQPELPVDPSSGVTPEVIAAITAAVSALWQEETGFVVRRVRRIQTAPAWNRAGRDDQIYSRL